MNPTIVVALIGVAGSIAVAVLNYLLTARVKTQEALVERQGRQLESQQELINNLVQYSMSASIFYHLCGIGLLKEYKYHHGAADSREMYFLRDNGFIRPKAGQFLDFNEATNEANLVDYAEPTEIGWSCIKLRKSDIPSNMLRDKGNLRIDPSAL